MIYCKLGEMTAIDGEVVIRADSVAGVLNRTPGVVPHYSCRSGFR